MSDGPPRGRARGRGLDVPQQPGGAAAPPRAQHLRPAAPMQPRMRSAGPQPQVRTPRPAAQQQQQQFRGMRPAGGPQHPSPITDAPSAWQRSPHVAMLPLPQPGPTTSRQAAPPLPPQQQQPAPTVRPEQPPATHVSRAYCRGTERVQSAIRSAQQTSGEASLPLQMSALSVEQANSGNGSNGNGSNGNGTTSSRGHSRGGHFSREDAKQMILRPHNNSKIGTGKLRRTNDMNLLVNYFEMEKCQDWRLNFYAVIYNPAQDDRRQRYKIMEPHLKHFGGHVFDGMNIFSRNLLPNKETVFSSTTSDGDYSITVKFVRELDSLDDQFIRILNLILRRCQAAIGLTLIGRHYFNVKNFQNLDADLKMRVYPGVQTSIRQHEDKILLNVDIVHKFQQQTSILDHIRTMRKDDRDRLLIGQIAMAEYNHLTYRIDHFDDTKNPMSTFQHRGETVTFKKYFEDKHRRIVTDLTQPLIYSKPTGRQLRSGMTEIYLVPELMRLTGIPDEIRTNFHKMKRLVDYTKMGVDRRVAALKKFNQDLQEDKVRKDLELWGLKLKTNLVSLTSGVMNQEEILLAGGMSAQYKADDADWTFGCRNKSMMVSIPLNNWVVLVGGRINVADVSAFIQMLQQAARSVGMMIRPPEMVQASGMHETEQEIMKHQGCQMIMIILDRQLQNKYGMLKKKLACSIGVLSQFVLASNVNPAKKGLMSIATKIAIQMNAKLGGEPWQVKQPAKTTMVIGYDVYHDTVTASKSYGAVVSSVNPQLTNYYGQVTEHNNKEELSNNFAVCIQKAVKAYHERNKCHPRNVVVYRDGVGEGQIEYVKQQEIPAIKSELAKINPGICLVFVVVCKRINTRIFRDMGSGGLANPPPGTVVDKTITLPYCYDFFLVSQKVREGTVSPTSYSILEDGSNFSVDMLQCFTYKLTHLYFNWQGTVRVPAPCLYAHKLAYMTGTGTHSQPSPRVADKLWFI